MHEDKFYRGLLFGIGQKHESFDTEPKALNNAFGEMLKKARDHEELQYLATIMIEDFDPVFGVYEHAHYMLLHGWSSFIISVPGWPSYEVKFCLSKDECKEEFEALKLPEDFINLIDCFNGLCKSR